MKQTTARGGEKASEPAAAPVPAVQERWTRLVISSQLKERVKVRRTDEPIDDPGSSLTGAVTPWLKGVGEAVQKRLKRPFRLMAHCTCPDRKPYDFDLAPETEKTVAELVELLKGHGPFVVVRRAELVIVFAIESAFVDTEDMPGRDTDKAKGEARHEDQAQGRLPAFNLAGAARSVRLARGLTLREVAEALGFRLTSWSDVEYGIKKMGPGTIEDLPNAVGVPMAWLVVLAISNPGPKGNPIAGHIRAAQRLIRKELERLSRPE